MNFASCSYDHKFLRSFTMELVGQGTIKVIPDMAIIQLGVETTNEILEIAQEENTLKTNQVINTLRRLGIRQQDIRTIRYNINKEIDYVDGERVERGYRVQNVLEVTIRDIERVGQVIDAAVTSGANTVQNIDFQISNPSLYYRQALNLAVEDANHKARALGRKMGVQVSNVPIQILEESYNQGPVVERYYSVEAGSPTPIEPGQNEITAKVKVIFSYYPYTV